MFCALCHLRFAIALKCQDRKTREEDGREFFWGNSGFREYKRLENRRDIQVHLVTNPEGTREQNGGWLG